MKVDDRILGALFALLGVVVLWHVQGFPVIPGQKFGAALFPGVISAGLVICGLLLARARPPAAHAQAGACSPSTSGRAIR